MTDLVFVDSNVLVYRRDGAAGVKQEGASRWIEALWQTGAGRVSVQVLGEFYVTVTQKLTPGMAREEAVAEVSDYYAWEPCPLSVDVQRRAFEVQQTHQLSYWDSLIVSAAETTGCRYLLTEDLQAGQRLGGLTVVSPFEHRPETLGLR